MENKKNMEIQTLIRKERIKQGISTRKFAKLIGCSHRSITYWDNGERSMSIDMIDKALKILNTRVTIGAVDNGFKEGLEEEGRLMELPCKVGDTVYEVIQDSVAGNYIGEYEVQDVAAKSIMYCDDWISLDDDNLFFTREEAETALRKIEKVRGKNVSEVGEK